MWTVSNALTLLPHPDSKQPRLDIQHRRPAATCELQMHGDKHERNEQPSATRQRNTTQCQLLSYSWTWVPTVSCGIRSNQYGGSSPRQHGRATHRTTDLRGRWKTQIQHHYLCLIVGSHRIRGKRSPSLRCKYEVRIPWKPHVKTEQALFTLVKSNSFIFVILLWKTQFVHLDTRHDWPPQEI